MQITMLLHLGHHSITLIFDIPLLLPLIVAVLLSGKREAGSLLVPKASAACNVRSQIS